MTLNKVPMTPAAMAHASSVRNMRSAIHAEKGADTLSALLDILLDTAKIAAQETPEFFSYYDLSARYGVSRKTLEAWKIPEHKFGGSVRFSRANVLQWERDRLQSTDNA